MVGKWRPGRAKARTLKRSMRAKPNNFLPGVGDNRDTRIRTLFNQANSTRMPEKQAIKTTDGRLPLLNPAARG